MTDVNGVTRRFELTATRAVILDVISSNIVDPLTGSAARTSTSEWIFNGDPETEGLGKGCGGYKYPIVILPFSEIEAENKVFDQSKQLISHSVAIECHSRSSGKGDDFVHGRDAANQLAEEIKHILEVTGKSELNKGALHLIGVNGSAEDTIYIGGNKTYMKTIEYLFRRFD